MSDTPLRPAQPSLWEATKYWLKLGFISFGGPAGQISIMHQELVEKRRWISEHRFLHALNYCMLLPGPEAIQLAIYISWLMHGVVGAIIGQYTIKGMIGTLRISSVFMTTCIPFLFQNCLWMILTTKLPCLHACAQGIR